MRWIGRALLWLLLVLPVAVAHAKPLKSPAAELRSRYTVIASGVIRSADTALVLEAVRPVNGRPEPGPELLLRIPDWLRARLAPGERVLVAYTPFRRDPTLVDRRILDPDGPRLLLVPGLEPALFRDTADTRVRLLDRDGAARHPTLEDALRGLSDPDPQWQNYYAHELALAPALRNVLRAEHAGAVRRLLEDDGAHASARALWLRLADSLPADDARWWHEAALNILLLSPVEGLADPLSGRAALVRTAFDALERAGVAIPVAALARWVACDQAALAESALLAVRRSAPAVEDSLIDAALARALLPASTRQFLEDHRKRLVLMRETLAKRAADSTPGKR